MRIPSSVLPAIFALAACSAPGTYSARTTTPRALDCDGVRRRAVADSGAGPVSIFLTTADDATSIPDSLAISLARAVAAKFKAPVVEQYPILGTPVVGGRSAFWGVSGSFNVVWHRDGRLTEAVVGATTLVPALDTAMMVALRALDEPSGERRLGEGDLRDSVPLVVRLNQFETPPVSVVLYPQKFARRSITSPLRDSEGNGIQAWLRTTAPTATDTGFVTLWFVVDTSGKVDPMTVQFLHRGTPGMMRALPAVALSEPYRPAEVDGCPVATLVVRRVDFGRSR